MEQEPTAVAEAASCATCAGGGTGATVPISYVYAIGKIEARFPRLSVEKEFAQAVGRGNTPGLTDQQAFAEALGKPENRYLTRQLCWVLSIQGLETYVLHPRNPIDFDQLVDSIRSRPTPADIDVVIGLRGPICPPDMCNGLMVPMVAFDQVYLFDRDALLNALPQPDDKARQEKYRAAADETFDRIQHITDNAGATDEHRALNYLAMRDPGVYSRTAELFGREFALTAVETFSSPLTGARKLVDVVFSYTNRETAFVEKYFVRVDVTEQFPFLVSRIAAWYDR